MKLMHIKKKVLSAFTATSVLIGTVLIGSSNAAGTASLSLSSSSTSLQNGTTLTVVVNVTSTDLINTVQADIAYDPSKLEFQSIDSNGSAFDFPLASTGGGGSIQISRGISAGGTVSGTKKIASISFKALSSSGSTSISFANSSLVIRPSDGENVWNTVTTGASYTFSTAVSPPAPAPTPAPTPNPSSNKPTTTQPTSPSAATANPKLATAPTTNVNNPTETIPVDQPVVVSNSPVDVQDGYLVSIQVFNKDKKAESGIEVELNDVKATTDSLGIASFSAVKAGTYTVRVAGISKEIEIVGGDTASVQEFEFSLGNSDTNPSVGDKVSNNYIYKVFAVLVVLAVGILVKFKVISKLQNRSRLDNKGLENLTINKNQQPPQQMSHEDVSSQATTSATPPQPKLKPYIPPSPSTVIEPKQNQE